MTTTKIHSTLVSDPDFAGLVSEFVYEIPNRVAAIRTEMVESKRERLSTLVHQLRGACGSYGFHELTPIATSIEEGLRAGRPIAELVPQLDTFLSSCLCMTAEPVETVSGE